MMVMLFRLLCLISVCVLCLCGGGVWVPVVLLEVLLRFDLASKVV